MIEMKFNQGQTNVGQWDRSLRILAGLCLIGILFIEESSWRWIGLLGITYIITGITRRCPAYTLMGINTCRTETIPE